MYDYTEDNSLNPYLRQRIYHIRETLRNENELPIIDQIFKYELKKNFEDINDLLHYVNGIIYKGIDSFEKLTLLFTYDDKNDYDTTNLKQNDFIYLLRQKTKFRIKYKDENYIEYLRTNPLIFIDTLNNLLIIPGINFEYRLHNFDTKNSKYFLKKSDTKVNSFYNPFFIRVKNTNLKKTHKIYRRTAKNSSTNKEHHIEHYFVKQNSIPLTKKLKTDDSTNADSNNTTIPLNTLCEEISSKEQTCNTQNNYTNHICEKPINQNISIHSQTKSEPKKERRKRRSLNTSTISDANNTDLGKNSKRNISRSLKRKASQSNSTKQSKCEEDAQQEDEETTIEEENKKIKEVEKEKIKEESNTNGKVNEKINNKNDQYAEDYGDNIDQEDYSSLNNYSSSTNSPKNTKSTYFFYDLINEYEIYINHAKCYIIFDIKSYYKNLDIMKKLKKNLEELKKPNNLFKEITQKKTFKSSRDKMEFIKRFKKMIIPNFRLEKIRKQRNHLVIIELMSKIQNSLIIKRLYKELLEKVNIEELIKNMVILFEKCVYNMKEQEIKNFYLRMIHTYFRSKDVKEIDFRKLIQQFKKIEEYRKNQEFYNLFQNDLNYLEKNKRECQEIEEKIHSLKYLILESILKEKQLERSVNRLLLNHEQSKYGYFYKVDQSDENNLDTTEYGKLLENFSKEPVNFYTILNKRNLDKHAYHDIRNFNYKKKNIEEEQAKQVNNNNYNNVNINGEDPHINNNQNLNEEKQPSERIEKNEKDQIINTNAQKENKISNIKEKQSPKDNHVNKNDNMNKQYYKCKIKQMNNEKKNDEQKEKNVVLKKKKKYNAFNIFPKNNKKDSNEPYDKNYFRKEEKLLSTINLRKRLAEIDKNPYSKSEDNNNNNNELSGEGRISSTGPYKTEEYLNEIKKDIVRCICEKKNYNFINEKQEKINNEIFYKVFEQYPYSFFSKSVKNYNIILNENEEESELSWLTMLKKKSHNRSILPPSRDTFRDGTHFSNCRATEHTLKFFLSLLTLLRKGPIDINLKKYLKKNIQFLNTELFSMKLNLDKKRAILEKRLDHFNFQENSEFSFYNPLKINIRMMNLIGRGGFAEVWEVFDSINLEMYAAKIHKIEPSMSNEIKNKIIQRAENEINIHIHCHRHIFIVKLEFFFVFGSATNLLVGMELCDIDLDKYIKYHGPINELLALCWIKQILLGLLYMKNLPTGKVHHCDLKPANLLIKDGIIKISDFGLAKLILPDTHQYYNGGGTLYYQPPECLKNKKNLLITDKIDIWSLGCILYEMLFCERPFQFNYLEKCSKELLVNKMKNGLTYPKINQKISNATLSYIQYLLNFDYELRPSIEEALSYPIFNYFNIP
ncbi:serine/threonine protein kinase, putative [Plasmodium sp. gorilla clade G2]|uniref:serine/threonine protein kinase, putative n=1 Tax=Plasmodium sp. gorilla clade G2 TaxID=880535 RepID=UPI000D215FB0|nr:serine/threonine protein kinase, putative [Plasmodium sp. gorilla clade G2]SOV16148.1 serine/threonine protein kinase, putative [Plasmodium sp. gorilla clade G2]